MMKFLFFSLFCLFSLKLSTNEITNQELYSLQQKFKENEDEFIKNHSNKENFIVIFSNYTQKDGRILYKEYKDKKLNNSIQDILDNLNKIQIESDKDFEFDSLNNRFIASSSVKNYPDYFKWKMIISILKTMKQKQKNDSSSSSLMFNDLKIIDPPK